MYTVPSKEMFSFGRWGSDASSELAWKCEVDWVRTSCLGRNIVELEVSHPISLARGRAVFPVLLHAFS